MNFEFIRKSPKHWHFLNWNYILLIYIGIIDASNYAMFLLLEHNLSFHLFRIPFADFGRFLCFPQKSLLWSSLAYTCSLCPLPYLPYSPLSLSPLEPAKPFPIIHHLHPISVAWKFFPLIFTLWVLLIIQPSYYMSPL